MSAPVWTQEGRTVYRDGEPVCAFCARVGTECDPLAERPGWLPGVLMHERCDDETHRGGLD